MEMVLICEKFYLFKSQEKKLDQAFLFNY